ncbi:MAG: TIGR01212 family radical SAM protein [Dethiobacter sp.]|nr:MAG: TIGR01212 family radical SAM protein [Dethiobacter sp.]
MKLPPPGWYYRLSTFFKEKFKEKVSKIPLDAGFSCPNRDGTISTGGCIYCCNPSFSPGALAREKTGTKPAIREQILRFQSRLEKGREDTGPEIIPEGFIPRRKYLAYFQAYSNTYASVSRLKELYEEALQTPGIIGLSIATRPDCLGPGVLELLAGYARDFHIWLELGLQSAHDRTLELINRGHNYRQFQEAVLKSQSTGIYLCAHIINGLPGEGREEMLETIHRINSLPLDGIKFHQLQIFSHTPLEWLYRQEEFKVLAMGEYLEILCDQLEILRPDVVVHRLLSEATSSDFLLAPDWHVPRALFSQLVEKELKVRRSYQGQKYAGTKTFV